MLQSKSFPKCSLGGECENYRKIMNDTNIHVHLLAINMIIITSITTFVVIVAVLLLVFVFLLSLI